MTGLEVMVHRATLAQRAQRVAELDDGERRRVATQAARDRDPAALWALTEAYLITRGHKGARVAKSTLANYELGVRRLLDYLGERGETVLRPRPDAGFSYARHLEALGLKTATVRVRLAAAGHLYGALRWCNATDAAPFTDVKPAPDPVPKTQKRRPYSDADLQRLLAAATPEQAVIVLLGAHGGLRASEIADLHWSDLHLGSDPPFITVRGKGGKVQDVEASDPLVAVLQRWRTTLGKAAGLRVLPSWSRRTVLNQLEALCARAGVEWDRRHVHGLRHTAGTKLYEDTRDLLEVREHLRHASVSSTEIYVEYAKQRRKSKVRNW